MSTAFKFWIPLKDTGHLDNNIVKDQSSYLVYPMMHKITNLWNLELNNWSSKFGR